MAEDVFRQFELFDFESNSAFQEGWKSISVKLGADERTYLNAKIFFYSKHVHPLSLDQYLLWVKKSSASSDRLVDCQRSKSGTQISSEFAQHPQSLHPSSQPFNSPVLNQDCSESSNLMALSGREQECMEIVSSSCSSTEGLHSSRPVTNMPINEAGYLDVEFQEKIRDISQSFVEVSIESTTVASSSAGIQQLNPSDQEISSSSAKYDSSSPCDVESSPSSELLPGDNEDEPPNLSLAELVELIQSKQPIPGLKKVDVKPTLAAPTPSVLSRRPKPWQSASPDCSSMN